MCTLGERRRGADSVLLRQDFVPGLSGYEETQIATPGI